MSDVDGRFTYGGFVLGDIANMLIECHGVPVTNLDGTFFDDGPYNGKLLIAKQSCHMISVSHFLAP